MAPAPKGAAEVFSFHAKKILNAFEGELAATDDDEIHARVRSMHNFGFDDAMEVAGPGTNAKMSESSAAMGIASVERLDDTLSTYRSLHLHYRDGLDEVPGVTLIEAPARQTHNHPYVVVRVDPGAASLDRDRLFDILGAENIRTKKYFAPGCHRMPPYRADAVHTPLDLPATEELAGRVLALPIGLSVAPDDVDLICDVIAAAVRHAWPTAAAGSPRLPPLGGADVGRETLDVLGGAAGPVLRAVLLAFLATVPCVRCTTVSYAFKSSHQCGGWNSSVGSPVMGPTKRVCGSRSLRGYSKEGTVPRRCSDGMRMMFSKAPASIRSRPTWARVLSASRRSSRMMMWSPVHFSIRLRRRARGRWRSAAGPCRTARCPGC
ncbi:DegT/DnrJ/EryC1/StrS family aminotransferase [Streptomyces sp. NBC_01381]|uniref:DegT/DnrJ/EryC1/StrS family aminotransferase n=1 Tax=Streptomyces sp. NBC_01381 TaxID=2903845 RepID=UPI002255876B|nr:DegT/DnrJ/EryC1/StrS family aminotransferase [Streptomyces sp. NBC_01381]MCX4671760.1 DegT/DnrJ/EryC1/StrS family aminotransferase [Streptomyces sp. NBC_01381]